MIKLCGIRRKEDIEYVNEFLPDHIGMILSDGFRRTVGADTAAEITKNLDGRIKKVGVFVDEELSFIESAAEKIGLDVIQLHGNENSELIGKLKAKGFTVWKAVRVRSSEDILSAETLGADMLLLDSFVKGIVGGTGVSANWDTIKKTKINSPFFLAGGINENNLQEALTVSPNVDISGGIETDGVKDKDKIEKVMKIYKGVNSHEQG